MNIKLVAAALALPVLLAACAPEVESTVYLADVMKAVESGEAVSVPAVLRVPQSGEDECKEGHQYRLRDKLNDQYICEIL